VNAIAVRYSPKFECTDTILIAAPIRFNEKDRSAAFKKLLAETANLIEVF
jgi:hypothetical protein